jgi:mRNA interferase MazF
MKEGAVVLVAIPQADNQTKVRPALILREFPLPYRDFLVCGISAKFHEKIEDFDEVILREDEDFPKSGLIRESLVRLTFLAMVPSNRIAGSLGEISKERHQRLLRRLSDYLISGRSE